MRVCLLMILALPVGCASPDLSMRRVPARQVTVDGSRFSVYVKGDKAEAIRTNFEYRDGIMARGHRAIELASGCAVVPGSYDGDPARMTAELACGVS
ncbi:MAG: hypothetical protein WCD16_13675 [Paracoccaceae bacterium]